jgi:hypothetical protein
MYFFLRSGWQVQFLEPDLKTPLPKKLTFADPEKIRELARRGEAWGDIRGKADAGTRDRDGQGWSLSETHTCAVREEPHA